MADLNRLYNHLMSFILTHRPTARWMIFFYTVMDMLWPGWDGHVDNFHEEQWEEWEEDWGNDAEWDEQEWNWEEDGGFFPDYMIAYDPFW
ncbi:hypothetical protein BDW75DRAFT_242346 [Aspergillus navahoensis]